MLWWRVRKTQGNQTEMIVEMNNKRGLNFHDVNREKKYIHKSELRHIDIKT